MQIKKELSAKEEQLWVEMEQKKMLEDMLIQME